MAATIFRRRYRRVGSHLERRNNKLEYQRRHDMLEPRKTGKGGQAMTSIALVIIFAAIMGYAWEVMKDEKS